MFSAIRKAGASTPLHVAAFASLAISQPLFDVFGRAPEFLLAHDLGPADILALVIVIGALVPATAGGIVWVLERLHRATAGAAAGAFVFLFTGLIAIYAMKDGPQSASTTFAIAGVCGAVACALYSSVAAARAFVAWLTPGIILFPLVFLLRPGVQGLIRPPVSELAPSAKTDVPVVIVVFDGLPLTALLDRGGQIDAHAFPSFAALASQATWYRNATAVSDYTRWALPAILSGRYPVASALPIAGDHPNTIFSLLGASYDVKVHEPITRLCPESVCDHDTDGITGKISEFAPTISASYLHTILPEELESSLPPLNQGWAEGVPPSEIPGEVWLKGGDQSRRGQAVAFVDAIDDAEEGATFHFLHVLLPHTPLSYLPKGQRYGTERSLPGLLEGRRDQWRDDDWAVTQGYRRFLLQVGYVDTLLGHIVDRLKATGLYDRALLVVTSDHGASFKPGKAFRRVTDETFMDVLPVPLLIKEPNQRVGKTSDVNAQAIDVLPTIADLLDVPLPWTVDGVSLSGTPSERAGKTVYFDDAKRVRTFPASLLPDVYTSVERKHELFGSAEDNYYRIPRASPLRELIGREVGDLQISNETDGVEFSIDVHGDFSDVDPGSRYLPAYLAGRARWRNRAEPVLLAVALNGVIRATTRTYRFSERGAENVWSMVLTPDTFRPGRNDIEIFVVDPGARGTVLRRAHFSEDRPLDLTSNAAAYGLGVTYEGFSPRDGTGDGSVRWTKPRARMIVPLSARRRPRSLRLFLGDSGKEPASLQVLIDGCEIFTGDVGTGAPWSDVFSLSACALEDATAAVDLITRRAESSVLKDAGVPVERIELLDHGWPPAPSPLAASGQRSQLTLLNASENAAVRAGSTVGMRVANRGNAVWATPTDLKQELGSVRLGVQWLRGDGSELAVAVQRLELPRALFPGDVFELTIPLTPIGPDGSQLPPGEYQVRIGLLQEGNNWFYASGDSARKLRVIHGARP